LARSELMAAEPVGACEFPQDDAIIYLNHAAVAPWPVRTARAVRAFAEENLRRGAADYPRWLKIERNLRGRLQRLIQAASVDDIALVKNTSEGLSLIAYGLDWRAGDNIIISNQEFPSNRIVWESLRTQGVEVRKAVLTGHASPEEAVMALADARTRLLALSSVQYGTGLAMDLPTLGAFCRQQGILFCVDAIQSLGALRFDARASHADFVVADGHKWMLGPEGLAVFYATPEARDRLRLSQYGWHMVRHAGDFDRVEWEVAQSARRFEPGSPNTLGIHALNASLSLLEEVGMERVEAAVLANAAYLIECIGSNSDLELITPAEANRHAGIVTFSHRHADHAVLFRHLTAHGVVCAMRGGGIRFSPHFYTSREKMNRATVWVSEYSA
jgi:cysteine desulfurase/selenocysteine lyase